MRGVMNLRNVTKIDFYALAAWGFTDFILPKMTELIQ